MTNIYRSKHPWSTRESELCCSRPIHESDATEWDAGCPSTRWRWRLV